VCHILVVDDDAEVVNTLQGVLPDYGFQVVAASKEEEIFDNILHYKPKVILLDVNLHGSDGRNICKGLKNHYKTREIPVFLFSGDSKFQNDVSDCQAENFISKPVKLNELIPTLKNYCCGQVTSLATTA
jgi:CheY-like chemotaxis protein